MPLFLYIGLYDEEVFNLLNERKIVIKKQLGDFDFRKFVIHDKKNLDHYSHIIVDLNASINSDEEIIEAIKAYQMLYSSILIIFAREIKNKLLYRIVTEANFYNMVIPIDYVEKTQDLETSFTECLDNNELYSKKLREYARRINYRYIFPKNLKVLVGGISSILNTTKTALNIGMYLSEIGAKVSYTEVFPNLGYLRKLSKHYKFEDSMYKDIRFFYDGDVPVDKYNFNIIDIGTLDGRGKDILNMEKFEGIRIVTVSNMETELEKLVTLKIPNDIDIIFDKIMNKDIVRDLFSDRKIHFNNMGNNFFDTSNSHVFYDILSKYIVNNDNL